MSWQSRQRLYFWPSCVLWLLFTFTACAEVPSSSDGEQDLPQKAPAAFSHVIASDTEYYTTSPQQGRPPDGQLKAGTKVQRIEENGSYVRVRSSNGIVAYVAADRLKKIEGKEVEITPDIAAVVKGNNRFALELYGELASAEAGNLFFSPSSISTAFAMVYAGARGETEQQMKATLHFALPQQRLHPAFDSLSSAIIGSDDKDYQLRIANRLWGQQGYDFLPGFLEVTREHYDAELAQVDFSEQTEAARREINAWVEEQTEQKIENLLPQGVLDSMTRLVLTNAIYFKGQWTEPFEEQQTREAPFHVTAAESIDVPMMQQKSDFNYGESEGLQVLELPYGKDKQLSMLILLPKENAGLADLEQKLTSENLSKWTSGLRQQEVQAFLPRFKMTSQFQLNDTLQSMGMKDAFDPNEANLSGMNGKRDLFISAAIHKAFVDVNEEGTEAAAATGVAIGLLSAKEPVVFRADHPFAFLIRHNPTGGILFLGRVANPQP